LRWQKQQWQQTLAQVPPGAPVLTSPADRAWFHGCLDMLRDAGEEVPQAFYRPGSIIPAGRDEGREMVRISLKSLVADIARVLAYFSDEADDDPGASVPADRS
jgi:hypothetical protein